MAILENTSLNRLLKVKKFKNRWGKLGHETYAYNDSGIVKISLFGNTIATLRHVDNHGVMIQVSDAGWSTKSTIDRINQILSANYIPAYACQRKHEIKLFWRNQDEKTQDSLWSTTSYGYSAFHSAIFAREYFQETWKVVPG